ncbi:MAG: Rpn family recombination-promoting nuclease/putative transposase [Planctomycetaceae bacterium]|jgi:hypothetical protein|nr:Rpn family recombination-promoting nuclease/putative transposase [Planctomycetaceae bacterium]
MVENQISEIKSQKPHNPHDKFARGTVGNPAYASGFLLNYAPPVVAEFVDLEYLEATPTHFLSPQLKEVIADISFLSSLKDASEMTEVLIFFEHKSHSDKKLLVQLLLQMAWALYFHLITKGLLPNYQPPIPLMVVLYNGVNKEYGYEIRFQDLFPNLPERLKPYVVQFKVIFINLNWFSYDNLPGKPETKAIVESMKRTTDGTFAPNLERILGYLSPLPSDEHVRDIVAKITTYCSWVSNMKSEEIQKIIKKNFYRTRRC